MRPRALVGTVALALVTTAFTTVPAQAGSTLTAAKCQNHWDGNWDTGSGPTHYGIVRFRQNNGDDKVTGTYKFSGGGRINGTASGNECWNLYARWKDKSGEGDLYVSITPGDTAHFSGWARRCKTACFLATKTDWHGSLIGGS